MSETVELAVGSGVWAVTIPADKRVPLVRGDTSAPAAGHVELLRAALDQTVGLNAPLRYAVTPDDHAVVVVDESLPHVGELVGELLAHLGQGGVKPASVTLLVPPPSGSQLWIDDLPDEFGDVHVEVHDPADVKKLAYLGTTKAGRRVYLNRSLVEAEFVVVLSGRKFDRTTGYAGAEASLFPVLSDAETRAEFATVEPADRSKVRAEAAVVAWQLGSPAFVQVIEGMGDAIAEVLVGLPESSPRGVERQNARWRGTVGSRADLVIVPVSGSPGRVTFHDLVTAVGCGRKVLKPDGRLVLVSDAAPEVDESVPKEDRDRWARTAKKVHLFVAAGWDEDVVEDQLSATRLTSPAELQRLIAAAERVIVIPDAHKSRVEVE
jgi:nickel-dependent lactate racemase